MKKRKLIITVYGTTDFLNLVADLVECVTATVAESKRGEECIDIDDGPENVIALPWHRAFAS